MLGSVVLDNIVSGARLTSSKRCRQIWRLFELGIDPGFCWRRTGELTHRSYAWITVVDGCGAMLSLLPLSLLSLLFVAPT